MIHRGDKYVGHYTRQLKPIAVLLINFCGFVCSRKEPIAEEDQWFKLFDVRRRGHAIFGNDIRSRILIVTDTKLEDIEKVEELKKKFQNCQWEVVDRHQGIDKLKEKIRKWCPTNVVVHFQHEATVTEGYGHIFPDYKEGTFLGSFFKDLNDGGEVFALEIRKPFSEHFLFYEVTNLYWPSLNGVYLMSSTQTNGKGWCEELKKLVKDGVIPTDIPFKIVVVSGGHGNTNYISGKQMLKIMVYSAGRLRRDTYSRGKTFPLF